MKYVTYWYQFFTCCEELVPILHSVKFANCDICGSTGLSCILCLCFVTFPYGVLGQVWYLIVLIRDLCFLSWLIPDYCDIPYLNVSAINFTALLLLPPWNIYNL